MYTLKIYHPKFNKNLTLQTPVFNLRPLINYIPASNIRYNE
jgi:hypothetical protein